MKRLLSIFLTMAFAISMNAFAVTDTCNNGGHCTGNASQACTTDADCNGGSTTTTGSGTTVTNNFTPTTGAVTNTNTANGGTGGTATGGNSTTGPITNTNVTGPSTSNSGGNTLNNGSSSTSGASAVNGNNTLTGGNNAASATTGPVSSTNKNTNNNSATQGQLQGQQQGQSSVNNVSNSATGGAGGQGGQGGSATGGTASSLSDSHAVTTQGQTANGGSVNGSGNGGVSTVEIQGSTYEAQARNPVNTAIAPTVINGSDQCLVTVTGGVQAVVVGVSFGSAKRDEICEMMKLSDRLKQLGQTDAAIELLSQDERVQKALDSVQRKREAKHSEVIYDQSQAIVAKPKALSRNEYEGRDLPLQPTVMVNPAVATFPLR